MGKNWYVIHIYSGYENKVETGLKKLKEQEGFQEVVGEIKVPQEDAVEMRNGKKRNVKRKFFPGYLLVELDLLDDKDATPEGKKAWREVCANINNLPGVTGFVGATKGKKPRPISNEDASAILHKMGEIKATETVIPKLEFNIGEQVKVVDGPFANFPGVIEGINSEKGKLKVKVEIFGRPTPIELDYLQVEKV